MPETLKCMQIYDMHTHMRTLDTRNLVARKYIHTHTHRHACIGMQLRTNLFVYIYTCMYIYLNTYTNMLYHRSQHFEICCIVYIYKSCLYTCMCMRTFIYINPYKKICYSYVHIRTYIHAYVYINEAGT